jgi:cytochrome b
MANPVVSLEPGAAVCGMWFTGEQGGDWLQYHIWSGEAIAALLLFRLIWGVMGSETARFSQFVKGPAAIRRYLQGGEAERPAIIRWVA